MSPNKDPLQYDEDALRAYLEKGRRAVDSLLDRYLPAGGEEGEGSADGEAVLYGAIRYSLFAGGKRFRPNLCLAASESIGGAIGSAAAARSLALPFACAIELIHTYSLVHDDLPAMDDDDLRRGRPTSHKRYGEGTAILVGDALLTEAFRWVAGNDEEALSPKQRLAAIFEIASAAGMHGMVLGQFQDLQSQGKEEIHPKQLEAIHRHKTGALITASVRAGGIVGGATPEQLQSLTAYGQNIGLAFQVMDDLLDVLGETSQLGKSVGQDGLKEKWTYPRLVGAQESQEIAHQLAAAAIAALDPFGPTADPLRWIAGYTLRRRV